MAAAESQLGVPYVYGGEEPGVGFDCSGLVQWAAAQVGVSVPRTTQEQWTAIAAVAPGELVQVGDLVYFDVPADGGEQPQHVGIITSTEPPQMVEAPHAGTVVRVAPVPNDPAESIMGYRRLTFADVPAPAPAPEPSPSTGGTVQLPTIQNGSTGQPVKAAQAILNGTANQNLAVDGTFGPATEAAVRGYQAFLKLDVDGVVGPQTWTALLLA